MPPQCRFITLPLSSSSLPQRGSKIRPYPADSPRHTAESCSSSYGLTVHLQLLPTLPHDNAVIFSFRPESVCLGRTYTNLTKHAHRRTRTCVPRVNIPRVMKRMVNYRLGRVEPLVSPLWSAMRDNARSVDINAQDARSTNQPFTENGRRVSEYRSQMQHSAPDPSRTNKRGITAPVTSLSNYKDGLRLYQLTPRRALLHYPASPRSPDTLGEIQKR